MSGKCIACGRRLKNPSLANVQMGKICARRLKAVGESMPLPKFRVEPLTIAPAYRSYLVFSEPRRKVVITFGDGGGEKICFCPCDENSPTVQCAHISAALHKDAQKFPPGK